METATESNMTMKTKESRTTPKLIVKFLPFSEKFTILRKGIANRFNIVRPLRNIGITAILVAITLLNSSSTYIRPEFKVDVVVIDAGHGGNDPGTRGRKILEKDVALKIALKLGNYIQKNIPGVKAVRSHIAWVEPVSGMVIYDDRQDNGHAEN